MSNEAIDLESVCVRRMTAQDKDGVLETSIGVYDYKVPLSRDYLPCLFDQWLQDWDNHLMYGLLYQGKVIGFRCLTLIDNRTTVLQEAMRIHRNFRGKGFAKIFSDKLNALLPTILPPSVVRMRAATTKSAESVARVTNEGKTIIREHGFILFNLLSYYTNSNSNNSSDSRDSSNSTGHLSYDSIIQKWNNSANFSNHVTESPDVKRVKLHRIVSPQEAYAGIMNSLQLLRDMKCDSYNTSDKSPDSNVPNLLCFDWRPYILTPQLLETALGGKETFYQQEFYAEFSNSSNNDSNSNRAFKSFSYGTLNPKVGGLTWTCGIYSHDFSSCAQHFLYHTRRAAEQQCVMLQVFCEVQWKEQLLSYIQLLLREEDWLDYACIIYETDNLKALAE